jgi:Uma2 family endonuclease
MITLEISHPITFEDLESYPDELRLELHEGVLHIRPPESAWHSDISFRIASRLRVSGMQAFQGVLGTPLSINTS